MVVPHRLPQKMHLHDAIIIISRNISTEIKTFQPLQRLCRLAVRFEYVCTFVHTRTGLDKNKYK